MSFAMLRTFSPVGLDWTAKNLVYAESQEASTEASQSVRCLQDSWCAVLEREHSPWLVR